MLRQYLLVATGALACVESTYVMMHVGHCDSVAAFLTTKSECELAAASLDLADTTANTASYASNPKGCYYKISANQLYWNTVGGTTDGDTDKVSICTAGIAPDVCTVGASYVLMDVGRCDSVAAFVTNKAKCELAAASLCRNDTTANEVTYTSNAEGCYYKISDDRLYFNDGGSYTDDDADRVSICNATIRPAAPSHAPSTCPRPHSESVCITGCPATRTNATLIALPGRLSLPAHLPTNSTKLPAIIFLHGSGGMYLHDSPGDELVTNMRMWAEQAASRGFVSLYVDSYARPNGKASTYEYSTRVRLG